MKNFQEVEIVKMEPILVNIETAARLVALSRSKIYALMEQGNLPFHQFGTARRIDVKELKEWLEARREK